MPRPGLPPTPISSTEIRGKDQFEVIDDFSLPPAALHSNVSLLQSFPQSEINSADADSPTGAAKRKRRKPSMNSELQAPAHLAPAAAGSSSAAAETVFSLPPPPSRSRKIIQVQPEDAKGSSSKTSGQGRKKSESGKAAGGGGGSGSSGAGASKSTAASRKTARKTAHSIIERRRRSKMNEEFETLKELVPAARGQNMHKLAILQAGIEYVRYLEDCIHGLKGVHDSAQSSVKSTPFEPAPLEPKAKADSDVQFDDDMDEDDEDEMDDEEPEEEKQPASTPRPSRPASGHQSHSSVSSTPSPAIHPLSTKHYSSSSYAISTGSPSPAILPSFGGAYAGTAASSTLPSPALLPHDARGSYSAIGSGQVTPITTSSEYHALQAHAKKALACHEEEDQEVIATLTMMGTERRRSQEEKDRTDGTRGMSVRELLSG